MPNIDVIFTPVDDQTRNRLVQIIADTFVNELGCSPEAVTTRIHEIPKSHFAVGRNLLCEDFKCAAKTYTVQPLCEVRIGWYAGKSQQTEETVAMCLSRNISKTLEIPPESVEIGISVMHRGNYFIAGNRIDVSEPQ